MFSKKKAQKSIKFACLCDFHVIQMKLFVPIPFLNQFM